MNNLTQKLGIASECGYNAGKTFSFEESEKQRVKLYNEIQGIKDREDGIVCDICRNKGDILVFDGESAVYRECECMNRRRSVRRLKEKGLDSGIRSFSEYRTDMPWQKTIRASAEEFVRQTEEQLKSHLPLKWFYIGGQSGAGKTHICTAISAMLMGLGLSWEYCLWSSDIECLTDFSNENREQEFKQLANAKILYIDDFFYSSGEIPGRIIRRTFDLINARYLHRDKVTIFSSELHLSALGRINQSIAGRIAECATTEFVLTIPYGNDYNYRLKKQ